MSFLNQLAEQSLEEAVGEGVWVSLIEGKVKPKATDAAESVHMYKDIRIFTELEVDCVPLELPWDKVTALFNLARLLEQIHKTEPASLLYRLIVYKVSWDTKLHLQVYLFAIISSPNMLHDLF